MITDYDHLIDRLALPDPDDRHVFAAAIAPETSLVTLNVADFPRSDEDDAVGGDIDDDEVDRRHGRTYPFAADLLGRLRFRLAASIS